MKELIKKNSLIKNASILMAATIICRVIGLIYRRPLGEILGSVGLGYYGYASNLYSILLLISSYSIPMALSKIISERLAKKEYKNSQKIFRGALIYAFVVGGIFALIAWFGGSILLPANQQNAIPALRVLSPTIFLSAVLGVLRGYFQAHHNMTPTSVSQILEQIMNAAVSIIAAWLLISFFASGDETRTAVFGSMGGTMGTGAGVLTGLVFMIIVYGVNRRRIKDRMLSDTCVREDSYAEIFGAIILMMTPIIFTTFINNASTYLDSYLYAGIQGWHGIDADAISAAYGEFSNYYIPIIHIPLALASASSSAMMPEVSSAYALNDTKGVNAKVIQTIRMTMFICIPSMAGLTALAFPVMGVLFPAASDLAYRLLLTGSLQIVFSALCTVTCSALQAIGKQKTAMLNAAASLVVNLIALALMLALKAEFDIYAVMAAGIVFALVYCVFNSVSLAKYLGFKNEFRKTYAEPLLASLIMAVAAALVYWGLFHILRRPFICLVAAVIAGIIAYLVLYVIISRTGEDELRSFPMGKALVKVLKKIKVYR